MFHNFTFFVPRTVFGVGESRRLSVYVKKLGAKKALVLYDMAVKKAGVVDPIIEALNKDGIETAVFDKVVADPTMESVDAAADLAVAEKVDILIAVGGGSTIDTGKTARMLVTNGGKAADYTVDKGVDLFTKPGLPYIVVPTTSGTGSEVTFSSVLTNTELDRKVAVRDFQKMPVDYAVLDPETVLTVPPSVTAACGMDVLTHAAEAFLKPSATPFSDAINLYAVELCMQNLETAVKNGSDIEARANMMIACTMAGAGIASCGLHLGHGMAQAMGALWHQPHGITCAWALPYVYEHVCELMPEKSRQLAKAYGIGLNGSETPSEVKDLLFQATWALNKRIGIPTLADRGFTEEKDFEDIIRATAREQKLCQQSIRPFTEEDSRRYYHDLFNR